MADAVLRLAVWVEQLKAAARAGQRGQGMVEYGLIVALVAVALIVIMGALGTGIGNVFTNITAAL